MRSAPFCCAVCDKPRPVIAKNATSINPAMDSFSLISLIGSTPVFIVTSKVRQGQKVWLRDQRNCSRQLDINNEAKPVIDLVKLRGPFRSESLHELQPIVLAQGQGSVFDVDHALH